MLAEVRTFNDSQQHACSIQGWQQVYDQLGRGCLSSELRQISAERFQIFQEVLDKRVVQRGRAPQGRLCIAMSMASGSAPLAQGHQLAANSVALLRDAEEFVLHAPEGTHFFALNVDTVRFARLAAFELSKEQLKRLKTEPRISVNETVLSGIQQRIHSMFCHLLEHTAAINPASEKVLEDMLLDAFLDLFSQASDTVRCRRENFSVSAYLVKRCEELLAIHDTPLSILDLCEKLRVSRRTLQNSFQTVTGMRPVEYLRTLRLNAVRRQLLVTRASEKNVGDIAAAMGFFHLSHFAAHYKALFGESPSDTRRAS
ncbi:helix-turn-helix domain-containing protein [Pseudomonas capsici]|uniref:helix-turn-helix domain-containing protein n=1 Tax=Pseudomonas capsici TaxID=2810614 RepID=UPI0021F0A4E6|nr:helix-turn-helix domain-containing protein [Pseudomonas capsici]MCV4283354.1 helix-turn-helix domain-containing protein [Pseudomonas capsici]